MVWFRLTYRIAPSCQFSTGLVLRHWSVGPRRRENPQLRTFQDKGDIPGGGGRADHGLFLAWRGGWQTRGVTARSGVSISRPMSIGGVVYLPMTLKMSVQKGQWASSCRCLLMGWRCEVLGETGADAAVASFRHRWRLLAW